jgi:hypothetical protein
VTTFTSRIITSDIGICLRPARSFSVLSLPSI